MPTDNELRNIARDIAEQAQTRASQFEREVSDLENRLTQAKAKRDAARLAPKRLANFPVQIGADYQCPRCWIEDETPSPLTAIGGGTRDEDFFRCHKCGTEFSIPVW